MAPPPSFPYRKILVLGATSGIGEALADRFIEHGASIIAVGRRKEQLDAFVARHGGTSAGKAFAEVFDITDLAGIPAFVERIIIAHPDLSAVFLNSGIQRGFNFARPETIDLDLVATEFTTNYLAYIHFTNAVLPFLQRVSAGGEPAVLLYTTSQLALVPLLRCPNYCATKAALHHWILCLRQQLKNEGSRVKVMEVLPPAVQTELHDEKHQPDIKDGRSVGMPLADFVNEAWAMLEKGEEQVPVGLAKDAYEAFEWKRQERMMGFWKRTGSA